MSWEILVYVSMLLPCVACSGDSDCFSSWSCAEGLYCFLRTISHTIAPMTAMVHMMMIIKWLVFTFHFFASFALRGVVGAGMHGVGVLKRALGVASTSLLGELEYHPDASPYTVVTKSCADGL